MTKLFLAYQRHEKIIFHQHLYLIKKDEQCGHYFDM